MNSRIFRGAVTHARSEPVRHAFRYRMFMLLLDLAELDEVFRGRWFWSARRPALAWFRRADHFGDPAVPLDRAVRDRVEAETGRRPEGPIRLLTHLRYFGFVFNPISIYFCMDAEDRRVEAMLLEVSNTPWGERCVYALGAGEADPQTGAARHAFKKEMHVSPYMQMDCEYQMETKLAGGELRIRMDIRRGGAQPLRAELRMTESPITARTLAASLAARPFMTAKVVAAIYFEALRLWLKGCPFIAHPGRRNVKREAARS